MVRATLLSRLTVVIGARLVTVLRGAVVGSGSSPYTERAPVMIKSLGGS